jgi:periplasmic copper chaperone A
MRRSPLQPVPHSWITDALPVAVTFLSAILCALTSTFSSAADITAPLQASEAWIRWLPANVPSGAYLTLSNSGSAPRTLESASSPDFAAISFHQTRMVNGVSEMSLADHLIVPPHGSLHFAPGGYHLMLMQPTRTLHTGDRVPMTLRFIDGSSLQVSFEVRDASLTQGVTQ